MDKKQKALADAAQALRERGVNDAELYAFVRAVRAAFQQGSGLGGGQIMDALNGAPRKYDAMEDASLDLPSDGTHED